MYIHTRQRIEPIGHDAQSNAYWLIGGMNFPLFDVVLTAVVGDRLWIQRAQPAPTSMLKRKRPDIEAAQNIPKLKPSAAKRTRPPTNIPSKLTSDSRGARTPADSPPGRRLSARLRGTYKAVPQGWVGNSEQKNVSVKPRVN